MASPEDRRGGPRHPESDRDRHPRGRRPFDYGALRLIVLGMIADAPRHGYELIRAIEERTGGGYSPSPGVIYPTLAWLEDMGYAIAEPEGGRKSYRLTGEGAAFLEANRPALAEIGARMGPHGHRHEAPEPVLEAMQGLKRALRARFASGPVEPAQAEDIAAAIRAAAGTVEKTMATTETLSATARVATPRAAGYAAQLAKHFAHKIPARFEDGAGEIVFTAGTCRLGAEGETLTLTIEAATAEALAQLEDVVARHLLRFAFREEMAVDWVRA